jgi:hypothetical protein
LRLAHFSARLQIISVESVAILFRGRALPFSNEFPRSEDRGYINVS